MTAWTLFLARILRVTHPWFTEIRRHMRLVKFRFRFINLNSGSTTCTSSSKSWVSLQCSTDCMSLKSSWASSIVRPSWARVGSIPLLIASSALSCCAIRMSRGRLLLPVRSSSFYELVLLANPWSVIFTNASTYSWVKKKLPTDQFFQISESALRLIMYIFKVQRWSKWLNYFSISCQIQHVSNCLDSPLLMAINSLLIFSPFGFFKGKI